MRTVLTFSLRFDATEPFETMQPRIEAGLGCKLRSGSFAQVPAVIGEVLGMKIGLFLWRGIGGAHVYQLHGGPDPDVGYDWQEIRIDQAIIDLLRDNGAGEWRQPSSAEHRAEAEYDLEDI